MLMADARPSRCDGVTVCRSVVMLIAHRIGPTPMTKKLAAASPKDGAQMVTTIRSAAASPATGPIAMTTPNGSAPITRPARSAPSTMPTRRCRA